MLHEKKSNTVYTKQCVRIKFYTESLYIDTEKNIWGQAWVKKEFFGMT